MLGRRRHVLTERLCGFDLRLPVHIPEEDAGAVDHLHVLLVPGSVIFKADDRITLCALLYDLLFILWNIDIKMPLTQPPLLVLYW